MKALFVSWGGFEPMLDQNWITRLLAAEMKRPAMTTCSLFFQLWEYYRAKATSPQ
jgi:hypothetical protein